jgi:protoporphyrinogen oxidase
MFEGISRPFRAYLETFSSATFGAPASEVSALKGFYYLSREMGERYTCPGGNACVAEGLASRVEGRIELNSTVVSVEQKENSCYVTYVTVDGLVRTVECKAVVWASEKHYAPYIIRDLHKDQQDAFKKVRYSSFIVANVLVDKSFYNIAFATYFDNAFFADLVIADWAVKNKSLESNSPAVYTLYCPLGSKERHKVLNEPAETWRRKITESLEHNFGQVRDRIVGIKLYSYGHHYVVSYPGFISTDRIVMKRPFGNVFFAKDDTQGIPSLESAIWSGIDSAEKVLQKLK